MNFQDINSAASPETQVNENFETIEYSSVYGKRQPVTTGLTWGYYGGRWGGFSVSAGTLTLTNTSANYIVVARASGVISVSTAATNWNNTTDYARVYKVTCAGGVVSAIEDHRAGASGAHGGGGSGTVSTVSVTTANGVSGSVATATSTPAITITLGAITPSSVNGVTIASGAGLASDTDGTLAANSDTRAATQKAVKTYVDGIVTGGATDVMVFKGVINCSANPNYPAADAGHLYKISVAGKIGGGSGTNVEAGDTIYCITDATSAGTQAGVGANWVVAQVNIDGAVTGPASATDSNFAQFDGPTGKLIKGGLSLDTDGTLAANSDTKIASQKAVKTYVAAAIVGGGGGSLTQGKAVAILSGWALP